MLQVEFISFMNNLTHNINIFDIKYNLSIKKERDIFMMSKKEFAMLIKSIRLMQMLTQIQMAGKIGVSPQTYKMWELAENLPTPTNLNKYINVCKLLNVPQTRINDIMISYQNSKLCVVNDIEETTYKQPHNKISNNRFANI